VWQGTDVFKLNRPIRVGIDIEQVNEDLFATKDIKFRLFNGHGVDAFSSNAVCCDEEEEACV
jgi:hypothetical protein